MKPFASSVTAFALLSTILAKDSDRNGTQATTSMPIILDGPVEVSFESISWHMLSYTGHDPANTFIFRINLPPNKGQNLTVNVAGIRTAIPNVELSVSQCNWSREICYPEKGSKTPWPFDHTIFGRSTNEATLEFSKVASNGTFYFLLQMPLNTGEDNLLEDEFIQKDFHQRFEIVTFNPKSVTAVSFSLNK